MFKFLKQMFIALFALACISGSALAADDDVLKPFVLGPKVRARWRRKPRRLRRR